MSESYINSHFSDIVSCGNVIEKRLFNDIDNGDFTLTNHSLATNAGNNTYFNQGTINGTFDTLDILGNRRIYYTTVDMGAFENQVAKDSPITSVNGRSITLTVTTKVDAVDPTDGVTSLREALEMADILHERGYQDITIRLARAYEIQLDGEQGSLSVNSPVTAVSCRGVRLRNWEYTFSSPGAADCRTSRTGTLSVSSQIGVSTE